jgi:DNA-binding NarL/FixJ family response regulator
MHSNEEYVCQALEVGAAGYLLKNCRTDELWQSIQTVARGDSYLSPLVSKQVIANYIHRTRAEPPPTRLLTPRQREILRLIALGRPTKAIAESLGISVKTVETHRAQLMDRLDIRDVAGLVRFAVRNGLATLDE